MRDIDAYMFLTHHAPTLGMSKKLQLDYFNEKKVMPFHMLEHEMTAILNFPPPIKYVIRAYRDAGFSVGWIAEHLNIPQPNVSYHLRTLPKQDWISQSWQYIRQMKRAELERQKGYEVL